MTFASITFLGFLVLVFAAYWSIRERRAQNTLLLAASYVFYGWWDWRFCSLMAVSSIIDFSVGVALDRTGRSRVRKALLGLSLAGNLGLLGVFKYFDFFADSFQIVATQLGWRVDSVALNFVLPVGISFYTFQTLGYSIDVYRKRIRATTSLLDFSVYVSFFPQLVAGPIERAERLLPQFERPRVFNQKEATEGFRMILWGLFKKIIVADRLAAMVDPIYGNPGAYGGAELLVATIGFSLQIYFDFSAYSEIASGTARLFGFTLMRNFDKPYLSANLVEFWRRWHISLSEWFRDYVYVPLGGSRCGRARHVVALMVTFLLSGLWHGAAWGFVVWGAIHGVAMILLSFRRRFITPRLIAVPVTFLFVCFSWVFFRAENLKDAAWILSEIASSALSPSSWHVAVPLIGVAPLALLPVVAEWIQRNRSHPLAMTLSTPSRWLIYTCLLWATLLLVPRDSGPFIYFQF